MSSAGCRRSSGGRSRSPPSRPRCGESDDAEQRIETALDLALVRYANARWQDTIEGLDALRSSAELDAQRQLVVDALIVGAAIFDRRLHHQFRAAADRIPDGLRGDSGGGADGAGSQGLGHASAWRSHSTRSSRSCYAPSTRPRQSRAADLGTDFGDPVLLLAGLDPTLAAALAEQRLVRARELGLEASHGIGQAALAMAAVGRGDFREGLDLCELVLATRDLHLRTRYTALDRASQALDYQGRADEAQQRLDELVSLGEDDEIVTAVAARRGELALLRRDYDTAERLLRPRCRPYLTDDPYPLLSGLGWLPSYARALAGLDRTPEAVAAIHAWLPKAERIGHAGELGDLLSTLGALTPGPDGLALLQRAVELLLPSPFRWQRARAQLELGSRLRRDGERTSAREHLYAALEYAVAEQCQPIEVRATEELRIMGGRPRKVVAHWPRVAHGLRAARRAPGRRGTDQQGDRAAPLPDGQDRRDAPRKHVSQARRQRTKGAPGSSDRVSPGSHPVANQGRSDRACP